MGNEEKVFEAEMLFAEGTRLYEQGDFHAAAKALKKALNILPDSEDILYNLALVCFERGDFSRARRYAGRIVGTDCGELLAALDEAEGKHIRFGSYCPVCVHFDENTGVCAELRENVREYPDKFVQKCGGRLFIRDENREVEPDDDDDGELSPTDMMELIPVAEAPDEGMVAVYRSILDDAGIPYSIENEYRPHFNRPARFFVREDDVEDAVALLKGGE